MQQCVAMATRLEGPNGVNVSVALDNLAISLREQVRPVCGVFVSHCQGRFAEARSLLERSLTIKLSTLGPWHESVGDTEHSLGDVCTEQVRLTVLPWLLGCW